MSDTVQVAARFPRDLVERIDAIAEAETRTRTGQLLHLVRVALEQQEKRAQDERRGARRAG